MKQWEFAEVLGPVLYERGKGDHILGMTEVSDQVWECDLSVDGRIVKITVPIAMKTKEEVRADILVQIAGH